MQTRFSGFVAKFFFEILPATLASAAAGFLFAHFGMPSFQQATAVSPVSAEMLKTVHDDHEAFVEYLKKASENRQPSQAERDAQARLKQEEQNAAAALRQAKEAEAKALAAARKVAARSQAKTVVPAPAEAPLGQLVVSRPAVPAATALPALPPPTVIATPVTPAPAPASPAPRRETASSSSGGWFSAGAPPRPPASLPQQNFSTASDAIGPGG